MRHAPARVEARVRDATLNAGPAAGTTAGPALRSLRAAAASRSARRATRVGPANGEGGRRPGGPRSPAPPARGEPASPAALRRRADCAAAAGRALTVGEAQGRQPAQQTMAGDRRAGLRSPAVIRLRRVGRRPPSITRCCAPTARFHAAAPYARPSACRRRARTDGGRYRHAARGAPTSRLSRPPFPVFYQGNSATDHRPQPAAVIVSPTFSLLLLFAGPLAGFTHHCVPVRLGPLQSRRIRAVSSACATPDPDGMDPGWLIALTTLPAQRLTSTYNSRRDYETWSAHLSNLGQQLYGPVRGTNSE